MLNNSLYGHLTDEHSSTYTFPYCSQKIPTDERMITQHWSNGNMVDVKISKNNDFNNNGEKGVNAPNPKMATPLIMERFRRFRLRK